MLDRVMRREKRSIYSPLVLGFLWSMGACGLHYAERKQTILQINIMNIAQTFSNKVVAEVAKGNHGQWGVDNSVAVIEELADEAYSSGEGFDVIRGLVKDLANPSAFRQKLEKLPVTNPAHIVPSGNKRGASISNTLATLNTLVAKA